VSAVAAAPVLELSGVRKAYGERVVLDGLDLAVHPGEIVGLLGRNGTGKTTAAEIAIGLRATDAGEVRLLGVDPRAADRNVRARVGATLERGGMPRPMRVREALALYASFWRDPLEPGALLDRLGLDRVADSAYRDLSAGERARLAVALALVGRPDVAILDEPTAAMDVAVRRETWRVLWELRADGMAVLLTTHLLDEAQTLADRVVVLARGQAVKAPARGDGTSARLELDEPASDAAVAALRERGVAADLLAAATYRVTGPDADTILAALGVWLPSTGRRVRTLRIGGDELESMLLDASEEVVG
jgi:ABC-2 type transport system ATP-binding protein